MYEKNAVQLLEEKVIPLLERLVKAFEKRPQASGEPEYLNLTEAARLTGFSYDHVRRAVERGDLPAADKGTGKKRVWRISRADLDRWMAKDRGGKHLPSRSEMEEKVSRYLPGVA